MTSDSGQPEQPAPLAVQRRSAVVDTNVWLDIYCFGDPVSRSLAAVLESARWTAARCEQTDAELAAVLQRERFSPTSAERFRWMECMRRWQTNTPLYSLREQAPYRCRDPHDQKFLDLALAARASALLTKDKALLAVRRSAIRYGLMILTPQQFMDRLREDGSALLDE